MSFFDGEILIPADKVLNALKDPVLGALPDGPLKGLLRMLTHEYDHENPPVMVIRHGGSSDGS